MKSILNKDIVLVFLGSFIIVCVILYFNFRNNHSDKNVLKEFNDSGQLIGTNEYIIKDGDTIIHGKFVNYNENGIKISEGQFKNNEPYGLNKYYYQDGKLESLCYRENSKITKEITEYYPNGKVKRYIMFDPLGLEAFIVKYDEQGLTIDFEGYPVLEIYQYKIANMKQFNINKKQFLKVGDTLNYSYIIANIPNATRTFKINNIGINDSKIKRIFEKLPPNQIDVKEILVKKGKNTIRIIVDYQFKDEIVPVITDTLFFDVKVH